MPGSPITASAPTRTPDKRDLGGAQPVDRRIAAARHAGGIGIDQEQPDPVAIAPLAGEARRDDELVGAVAVQDEALGAVEDVVRAVACGPWWRHRRDRSATGAPHARRRAAGSPAAIFGIRAARIASPAPSRSKPPPSTTVAKNGSSASARPNASMTIMVSTGPPPMPPCSSANGRPSRPSSA